MVKQKDYAPVFKAYDIRGVYPKELDKKFAYELGRAFVIFTNAKEVGVVYDGRTSSKPLFEGLSKGMVDQGADVIDLGALSTPGCYFSIKEGKYDAGIMITASHNSKEYNGFKLMSKGAAPIYSENGSLEILNIMDEGEYPEPKKKGKIKKKSFSKEYAKHLKELFPKNKKMSDAASELKIVIDQSNGVATVEVEVLKELFPKAKVLNPRVSGTFPGHQPDPVKPENRKKLVSEVKKTKSDIGIIFDGDGDRVCFVDEKGEYVRPDIILNILAENLKRGTLIYDTRSSRAVQEMSDERGLRAVMCKSGRTYFFSAMKQEKADLAAENSGHFFFKEFNYLDCAGMAAIKLFLKIMAEDEPFSALVLRNRRHFHSGEKNFKVKNQGKAFLLIEQAFQDARKTLFIDGLSIFYDNYWFNVRKSNTENIIRINAEANTEKELDNVIRKLNNIMALAK